MMSRGGDQMIGLTVEELRAFIKSDIKNLATSVTLESRKDIFSPSLPIKNEHLEKVGELLLKSLTEITLKAIEENNRVITSTIENLLGRKLD